MPFLPSEIVRALHALLELEISAVDRGAAKIQTAWFKGLLLY